MTYSPVEIYFRRSKLSTIAVGHNHFIEGWLYQILSAQLEQGDWGPVSCLHLGKIIELTPIQKIDWTR